MRYPPGHILIEIAFIFISCRYWWMCKLTMLS